MRVSILRQKSPESEPYREIFEYNGSTDNSVAGVLDHINYNDDIVDINGRRTERIGWECSCLQGICGACAMVINGVPALACETFVRDLKGEEIDIRPLRKFPVIHDLIVLYIVQGLNIYLFTGLNTKYAVWTGKLYEKDWQGI